jgi:hypothetical protein
MAFNINRFKENVNGYGFLRNNTFEVFVMQPPVLRNSNIINNDREINGNNIDDLLRYRIEQVRIPGISILSGEINRYGIGPVQKMPFNAQFPEITFSVLMDRNADLHHFWYNWIRSIFEFNGVEVGSSASIGPANRIPNYTAEYKENYSTIMQIVVYNHSGKAVQKINLFEAFPTSIKDIQLAWGDTQSLMRLAVSVAFTEYTVEGSSIESFYNPQPNNLNNSATGNIKTVP